MSLPGNLLGAIKGAAASGGGANGTAHNLFSGVSLRQRHRGGRRPTAGDLASSQSFESATPDASPELRPRRLSRALTSSTLPLPMPVPLRSPPPSPNLPARGSTPLDTVSKNAPPHIAVRYGDEIRLFAKSKYVSSGLTGGYVGTFEAEKRFLASKNPAKQGELACVPPILGAGMAAYRETRFTILSNNGLGIGAPVSYGDVVVLVDESGRVWNNKMGVGPSTKNGYFGPREPNTPGEMYVSFYQLLDDDDSGRGSSSSDESDSEDNFVFFSNLAKTTRSVAETTFGKPTQAEINLANAALRTMGKVMYYGDRNLLIDVADSNRTRSKFNRVITHFCKNDQQIVQGGYLRCDGRGKPILFEMHGAALPSITSIDMSERASFRLNAAASAVARTVEATRTENGVVEPTPSLSPSTRSFGSVDVGKPTVFTNVRRSMVITIRFSDGGCIILPCNRLAKNEGVPFYRVVLSGRRPLRVLMRASRPSKAGKKRKVDLRGTLRGTYRQIFQLSCVVVVAYLCAAYACSHVFGSVVVVPAIYVGLIAGAIVFLVEAFFPGKIVAARQVRPSLEQDDDQKIPVSSSGDEESMGDWQLTVLAIEASESEQNVELSTAPQQQLVEEAVKRLSLKVPKAFIVAEGGDLGKATERYEVTLAWRREVQADAILNSPQLHYDTIKTYYKQFLHKHDKLGHPVYFEKIGAINIKQLQKAGITQDDLFRHYLFAMEFTIKYAAYECCACEACASSDTQKLCLVLDTRGMGMKDMGGESFEFIRRCTGIMQRHYPQRSFKIFFVNVPSWFGMAWKGVKPLLNEATRAKTNILSENDTPSALLEFIDAESLPVEYGGKCACPGGCGDHSSYQRLQKMLVDSVKGQVRFEPGEIISDINRDRRLRGVCKSSASPMPLGNPPPSLQLGRNNSSSITSDAEFSSSSAGPLDRDFELLAHSGSGSGSEMCGGFLRSIPFGLFRDEVLRAGFLLKRSLRHKQFNPIWHRQVFVLHPDSLRFAKTLDSEIFQIISLTSDTVVRRTHKQNNSFEIITPAMAANSHSLLLYAPTAQVMNVWVDALTEVIDRLGGPPSATSSSASGSGNGNASNGEQTPARSPHTSFSRENSSTQSVVAAD